MSTRITGIKRVRKDLYLYRGVLIVAYKGRDSDYKIRRLFALCLPLDLENRFRQLGWEGGLNGDEVHMYMLWYRDYSRAVRRTRAGAVSDIDFMHIEGTHLVPGEKDLAWLQAHPEEVPLLLAQFPLIQGLKEILQDS